MRQLTGWHYLAIATIPLGIFLSLRFGLPGLALFTAINLLLCSYCPDTLLFQKRPDSVHRLSRKQFYTGELTINAVVVLSLLIIPVISIAIVWIYSPLDIAKFVLQWPSFEVVNDNVKLTLSSLADSSIQDSDLRHGTQKNIEEMQKYYTKSSLYAIVYRLTIYLFLPIMIAVSTFDRTRAARSGHEFSNSQKISMFERLIGVGIVLGLFLLVDYSCSTPYFWLFNSKASILNVILPFSLGFSFLALLIALDGLFAKPQTFRTEHATDYELYLERRKKRDFQ